MIFNILTTNYNVQNYLVAVFFVRKEGGLFLLFVDKLVDTSFSHKNNR